MFKKKDTKTVKQGAKAQAGKPAAKSGKVQTSKTAAKSRKAQSGKAVSKAGKAQAGKTAGYLIAALVEILLVFAAEMIFLKVRRSLT